MKILIVDDDELCRVMLSDMLDDLGECDQAKNGSEAIDAFARALSECAPYDLICLDIIMPEIDGLQVLKKIRAIEVENKVVFPDSVRVIMVSSMSDLEHIMASFDSRCEAYMIKPFERKQLINHLSLLGLQVGGHS
jgi:two-component system chemotaxis response regulator CheY